ncbi:SIR2 family protein [Microbacterium testaceum]|uniref:SIR2 family protein n=1 Tax=Microbacterium testaceum TaxID=2033 RepID=UPI002AC3B1BC|nr:SIR2 family protein [Microbacterium testaceum]MDZ5144940.1 SIR2 family protein [Microbacterium testaceum]
MMTNKGLSPLVSLATSMHAQPGVYALLLGSGVSTGAGVLTGWGVVEELVARIAAAADPSDPTASSTAREDPERWWKEYGEGDLGYAALLEQLGPSAAARQGLLAEFFEPRSSDDGTPALQPSRAHRAIAELVRRGTVKVIITTNFDRLMEQALEAVGVSPQVIFRPEVVNGMAPLAHSKATVIKLHGDYRDLGTRNTPTELSDYPSEWNDLLRQVFDEYGLIISGWSADWDVALVDALSSTIPRRYPLYWDSRSCRGNTAKQLLAARGGIVLPSSSADDLFSELTESVEALDRLSSAPLTTAMAIARLKRYLPDPVRRIDLHDLVMRVVDDVVKSISIAPVSATSDGQITLQTLDDAVDLHIHSMDQLAPLLIEGVRHDPQGTHDRLWLDVVQRLIDAATIYPSTFAPALHSLRLVPALVAVAVISVTATKRNREGPLLAIASEVEGAPRPGRTDNITAAQLLHYLNIIDNDNVNALPRWEGKTRWFYPASHLFKTEMRRFLGDLIPANGDYEEAYHGFEYRIGLIQQRSSERYQYPAIAGEYIGETAWIGDTPTAELALRRQAQRGHAGEWNALFSNMQNLDAGLLEHREVLKRYRRYS